MITGPSGVGKGTLIRGLLERVPELELSVSATTRAPRPGEQDGVDYHFLTPEQFEARVAAGDFVEHAELLREPLRHAALRARAPIRGRRRRGARDRGPGRPAGPRRDARRGRRVHRAAARATRSARGSFGRGTDGPEQVDERLRTAERELEAQPEFAHVVVNDRLEQATDELVGIVRARDGLLRRADRVGSGERAAARSTR